MADHSPVESEFAETFDFLETGGLHEIMGGVSVNYKNGNPHVVMSTHVAVALCALADEALHLRDRGVIVAHAA